MIDFFFSKGVWFYIASYINEWNGAGLDSGFSVIILGVGVSWTDNPYNPNRREWVIPRNAWDGIL